MARTLREALVAHKVFSTGREGVRMVEQGLIYINGFRVTSADTLVEPADVVTFTVRDGTTVFTFVDGGRTKE